MAIGLLRRDESRADGGAGAGLVLDDDRLAPLLLQLRGEKARLRLRRAARQIGNDDPHHAGRKVERAGRLRAGEAADRGERGQQAIHEHDPPPFIFGASHSMARNVVVLSYGGRVALFNERHPWTTAPKASPNSAPDSPMPICPRMWCMIASAGSSTPSVAPSRPSTRSRRASRGRWRCAVRLPA